MTRLSSRGGRRGLGALASLPTRLPLFPPLRGWGSGTTANPPPTPVTEQSADIGYTFVCLFGWYVCGFRRLTEMMDIMGSRFVVLQQQMLLLQSQQQQSDAVVEMEDCEDHTCTKHCILAS